MNYFLRFSIRVQLVCGVRELFGYEYSTER